MNGILNLLKPAGMTSHDCIAVLRKTTGLRRIGHTGTLDPNACGVLPLCFGQATRLIEYMEDEDKSYRCEALLGVVTDTQDIWGNLLEDRRAGLGPIREEALRDALQSFEGDIMQTPPAYSAVKIKGKRMYRYAREGIQVEAEPRRITVHKIRLIRYDAQNARALFDIRCSKGTYVRTICHDLGLNLGTGASMSFLLRTGSSGLYLNSSHALERVTASGRDGVASLLLPLSEGVRTLRRLDVDEPGAALFLNGNPSFADRIGRANSVQAGAAGRYAVYAGERLLGTACLEKGKGYRILKVLN